MTDVYWLEQTEADVPTENDWLSVGEAARLDSMRFPKRRADWRLGRWTAKRALALYLGVSGQHQALVDIELRPAPSGAPEVFLAGQPATTTISLSHRGSHAVCAAAAASVAIGCDLEIIEPRSDEFIADYFASEEQELIARAPASDRPRLAALLWSAKESALKAMRVGLRLDTRSVIVSPVLTGASDGVDNWRPLHAECDGGQIFHGWWQHTSSLIRTLVAAPSPEEPILLRLQATPLPLVAAR